MCAERTKAEEYHIDTGNGVASVAGSASCCTILRVLSRTSRDEE
jgi:hypothetical protein